MPEDNNKDAINLTEVNEAHNNVLTAIADNGDSEAAQVSFNTALANMTASANERLATEIEVGAKATAELAEANNQIETLNAKIEELQEAATESTEAHAAVVAANEETVVELNTKIEGLDTKVEELEAANAKLSAETKPKPKDLNDDVGDDKVVPTANLTPDALYNKLAKKHSVLSN